MACHQVGKVAEGLGRVVGFPDVDVDSAHMVGVAFRSLVAQPPEEFLQGFDVGVGQNRRDQFGLFAVVPCLDADIPLEFPLASLVVPCTPSVVAVFACGVLVVAGAEKLGSNFGCLAAADVVHFDFYANRLVLHVLNLPCGGLFHFAYPFRSCALRLAVCFPACTYIYHSNENNYQVLFCVYTADFCVYFAKGRGGYSPLSLGISPVRMKCT